MKRTKPNKTDLPCVKFNVYYKNRMKGLRETHKWFKDRPQKSENRKVAANLEILLERLPEELGKT